MRLSDPHAELPIKNHKYVKNCTELYLAQRGIDKIAHFEAFVNLEVLWINDNQLERLDGLDTCVRIKQLYAQNNRIRTLEGSSITKFTFLSDLRVYDNKLADLHSTLSVLSRFHHLHDLDLFGNPLQEEENYRLQVIRAIPSLLVLDRHVITDEERAKAVRLRPVDSVDNDKPQRAGTKKEVVPGAPPQVMSGTVKMLFKEVALIKQQQQEAAREALTKEFSGFSSAQQQVVNATKTKTQARDPVGGLDEWELADLHKRFNSMEEKKNSGVKHEDLASLLGYLPTRGFNALVNGQVFGNETEATPALTNALNELFPPDDRIQWPVLLEAFKSKRLCCKPMEQKQLQRLADSLFQQSNGLQRILQTMDDAQDGRKELSQKAHLFSQQAYHLQALADAQSSKATSSSVLELKSGLGLNPSVGTSGPVSTQTSIASKTRYFVTTFARESTSPREPSATFHELKDQRQQVDSALASKYKLRSKDISKYLAKQTPHETAKLVRRNLHM